MARRRCCRTTLSARSASSALECWTRRVTPRACSAPWPKHCINIEMITTSEIRITCIVAETQVEGGGEGPTHAAFRLDVPMVGRLPRTYLVISLNPGVLGKIGLNRVIYQKSNRFAGYVYCRKLNHFGGKSQIGAKFCQKSLDPSPLLV